MSRHKGDLQVPHRETFTVWHFWGEFTSSEKPDKHLDKKINTAWSALPSVWQMIVRPCTTGVAQQVSRLVSNQDCHFCFTRVLALQDLSSSRSCITVGNVKQVTLKVEPLNWGKKEEKGEKNTLIPYCATMNSAGVKSERVQKNRPTSVNHMTKGPHGSQLTFSASLCDV